MAALRAFPFYADNMTLDHHASTALHIGFPAEHQRARMSGPFSLQLASTEEEGYRKAILVYRFGEYNYPSDFFNQTRSDIVIPFIHHCAIEAQMAHNFYNGEGQVSISGELDQEARAIMAAKSPPAILSTHKVFVPPDHIDDPKSFLGYPIDEDSMTAYKLGKFGKVLKGCCPNTYGIYPTHFVALRSELYVEDKEKGQDQARMFILPEADGNIANRGKKFPEGGWTIYMFEQNGIQNGKARTLHFNTSFRETMETLTMLEDAFITPHLTEEAAYINSGHMLAHYGHYTDKMAALDAAYSPPASKHACRN